MENVKALVEELRKRGLSNGGSIGYHSGLMDEAADTIERLQAELKTAKINAYKECIEKVNERLAVLSFTSKSTEYSDGMYDCMEWVDSKIEELEKELVGEK